MKYIGGEYSLSDLIPFAIKDNTSSGSLIRDSFFPKELNNKKRVNLEVGADALAFIIASKFDIDSIDLFVPEHFCINTLDRVSLKFKGKIQFKKYLSLDDIKFSDKNKSLVLITHFNAYQKELVEKALKLKANFSEVFFIEDFVQAPFEINQLKLDAGFNSLRKFGLGEIAILYCEMTDLSIIDSSTSEYYVVKNNAKKVKDEYFKKLDSETEKKYLELFEKTKTLLDTKNIYQAKESEWHNLSRLDLNKIIEHRRRQYALLTDFLKDFKDVSIINGDYAYVMFTTSKRDELKKHLFKNGVFPVIHWLDANTMLSKNIMSLHIDHRYKEEDQLRVMNLIKEILR